MKVERSREFYRQFEEVHISSLFPSCSRTPSQLPTFKPQPRPSLPHPNKHPTFPIQPSPQTSNNNVSKNRPSPSSHRKLGRAPKLPPKGTKLTTTGHKRIFTSVSEKVQTARCRNCDSSAEPIGREDRSREADLRAAARTGVYAVLQKWFSFSSCAWLFEISHEACENEDQRPHEVGEDERREIKP